MTEKFPADVRLIVMDAGNSNLRIAGVRTRAELPPAGRLAAGRPLDLPDLVLLADIPTPGREAGPVEQKAFGRELAGILGARTSLPAVLASVVPAVTRTLQDLLPSLAVLDHTWKLPYRLTVDTPAAVGPDRLANVGAAAAAGLSDALVVDAGTATTFDLLQEGEFPGGLIAPGMALGATRLGEIAARLEPVPFASHPLEVGRDTAEAMGAGAWHTGRFGVQGVIDALLDRYGPRPVVLTGGLGNVLAEEGRPYDRFWTLRGAAWLYLLNHPEDPLA